MEDPMERIVKNALDSAKIQYVTDHEKRECRAVGLDFYLPGYDVHIEVKQFHSDRISEQMSRADNVIAIQGVAAAMFFASLIDEDF